MGQAPSSLRVEGGSGGYANPCRGYGYERGSAGPYPYPRDTRHVTRAVPLFTLIGLLTSLYDIFLCGCPSSKIRLISSDNNQILNCCVRGSKCLAQVREIKTHLVPRQVNPEGSILVHRAPCVCCSRLALCPLCTPGVSVHPISMARLTELGQLTFGVCHP